MRVFWTLYDLVDHVTQGSGEVVALNYWPNTDEISTPNDT